MVAIPILKSKKSDHFFIKFDYGLILSLLCQIKQSSYVKGGTHPFWLHTMSSRKLSVRLNWPNRHVENTEVRFVKMCYGFSFDQTKMEGYMKLILMRHAERDKLAGLMEPDQPLTEVGKINVRLVCRKLRYEFLSDGLNAIFSSPWRPALDTALLASSELLFKGQVVKVDSLAQDSFNKDDALNLIWNADASVILLVGHQPHLSTIVQDLTGTSVGIDRGGAVGLELLSIGQTGSITWQLSQAEIRHNIGLDEKHDLEVAFYRGEPAEALSWDEIDVGALIESMAREPFHIGGQEGIIETKVVRSHEWEFLLVLAISGAGIFTTKVIQEFASDTYKWIKDKLKESKQSNAEIRTDSGDTVSIEVEGTFEKVEEIVRIMKQAMNTRTRVKIILGPD